MTTYVVMYRWLSPPLSSWSGSRSILNRVQEETHTFRVIHAPPPSWYNFTEQVQERRLVPSFLHEVLRNVRAATHDFTKAPPGDDDDDGELEVSDVLTALLVLQSVRLPGVAQQTCLMCTSPVTESTPRQRNATRVSMERPRLPSRGHWTLQEISIDPSWREADADSPRLCAFHASEFILAFEAMWGFVEPPARIKIERRHSF